MNRLHAALVTSTATLALAALAPAAFSATLTNSTGLATPHTTVDFQSVPLVTGEPVTNQFASLGVTFLNAYGNPEVDPALFAMFQHFSGNHIGDFRPGIGPSGLFNASFSQTLQGVAFAIASADNATTTFSAYLGNTLVQSFSAPTALSDVNNYFGFTGIAFNRITISTSSFNSVFVLDNLQMTPVPEPASMALMLGGLGALAVRGIRPRRT